MHGVVKDKVTDAFNFNQRIFYDHKQFESYLKNRSTKFVDIDDALGKGKGDVLTIDDARTGGFDAALLAAEYGHYVSLFINPSYIENKEAYYFSYLDYLIETIQKKEVVIDGKSRLIKEMNDKYWLRQTLLCKLRQIRTEAERIYILQEVAKQVGVSLTMDELPDCVRTMTEEHLAQLVSNDHIKIENHGWTHTCISVLRDEEIMKEVQKSEDWIRAKCNRKPAYYVVPFGDQVVRSSCALSGKLLLLEDPRFHSGFLGERIYNRSTLLL